MWGLPHVRKSVCLLFAGTLVGAAAPASAQIYSWRDGNGHLVLSDTRRTGADVQAYAVPEAQTVRTTRPVTPDRSRPFDELIVENARRTGVRPDLVRAVVQVESAFDPNARSPKGAVGLMQLMPTTMREFGVEDAYNPAENVRAGTAYLRQLLDRYDGDEALALAAYNAGPTAVDRHEGVPPYHETQDYVKRVGSLAGDDAPTPKHVIYKTIEIVNGRPVPRYSDTKPREGPYEIVGR
jgi:soluble lytic murein transglycosylase-like protein